MIYLNLGNVYRAYDGVPVIADVTLTVAGGERVVLFGKNGSGKSTLLKIACGLVRPDAGTVSLFDCPLAAQGVTYLKEIGIALTEPHFVPSFTVEEYLRLCGKVQKITPSLITSRIAELSATFEIVPYLGKRIDQLSKGNQAIVSICAAVLHSPRLLFLDEPFANLDLRKRLLLTEFLLGLPPTSGLLMASQQVEPAVAVATTINLLDGGNLVRHWTTKATDPNSIINNLNELLTLRASDPQ